MPKPRLYFKQFNNKIPCGGFYQRGGTIKNKYIEDEKFNSMFAKKFNADYLRCITMNLDDYFTISTDIANGIYKKYYNIRFFSMDFLDYLQIIRGQKEMFDWLEKHGDTEVNEYNLLKTFTPILLNGKPMDMYDVVDLYVNNLGLKSVPSSDNEWILSDTKYISAYYENTTASFLSFIKNSTMIYGTNSELGSIGSGIQIDGKQGTITFIQESIEGYGQYKNVVDFTQAAP